MTSGSIFGIINHVIKLTKLKERTIMDAEQVANDLARHEAVCAERWKTAFNRFDDLDENVKRIETILISAAGALIVGGAGLIITMWNIH